MPEQPPIICLSTIHDGHERVGCALEPHPEGTDHRRGFLAWDNKGNWYACRQFPDLYTTVGALLREGREARGLTQAQVASSISLTRSSISNVEAGRQRLPLDVWVGHCQILGLNPADVISRATQGIGPGTGPLPARGDQRLTQLRRRLETAQRELGQLLDTFPGGDNA